MVLAHELSSGSSAKYFGAVLGVALLTTTMSYLLIFPALIKLRYSHGHVHRPYMVPGGMAGVWIVGCLTTCGRRWRRSPASGPASSPTARARA